MPTVTGEFAGVTTVTATCGSSWVFVAGFRGASDAAGGCGYIIQRRVQATFQGVAESEGEFDGVVRKTHFGTFTGQTVAAGRCSAGRVFHGGFSGVSATGGKLSVCHTKNGIIVGDLVNAVLGIWGFSTSRCDAPGCGAAMDEAVVFVNQAIQALYLRAKEFAFLGNERRYRSLGRWGPTTPPEFPTWNAASTYMAGQIVRYAPPQPGNEGIGPLFRAVIAIEPGWEPPLVNHEEYGTVWDAYTIEEGKIISGPMPGTVDSFVGNVVLDFWNAEIDDKFYSNALRPLPNVTALRQARDAYAGVSYYPGYLPGGEREPRPVAYYVEQSENKDVSSDSFEISLAPDLRDPSMDYIGLVGDGTISVNVESSIGSVTWTFSRTLTNFEFQYLQDKIERGDLLLLFSGITHGFVGCPKFSSFTKTSAVATVSFVGQSPIADGTYPMTMQNTFPDGTPAGWLVPRQILSYDVRVLPRVCCNDLSQPVPVPQNLAESLIMPLARYFGMSSRLFRSPEIAAQIQEQSAGALRSIGLAEPKAKEVRPNYQPADSVAS